MRKFLSAPYWIHLLVDTIIGQGLWWLISMLLGTPILIRSIMAGVILIASMVLVAWYLPKLKPQTAVADIKQTKRKPSRLRHDNVLWEDENGSAITGPLCPKDYAELMVERNGKVDSLRFDTLISDSTYHWRLYCPECKSKYLLGDEAKTVQASLEEARARFEGKRRRERSLYS